VKSFFLIYKNIDVFIDHENQKSKYKSLTKSCQLECSKDNANTFELLQNSLNKNKFIWAQFYLESNSDLDFEEQVRKHYFLRPFHRS